MDLMQYVTPLNMLIGALTTAGTGIGGYYAWKRSRQQNTKTDLDDEIQRRHDCEEKLNDLEVRIKILEARDEAGFPSWKKTQFGEYIWVNAEFIRLVLVPLGMGPRSIIGKRDSQIKEFNPELANQLQTLDKQAAIKGYATANGVIFHESTPPMTIVEKVHASGVEGMVYISAIACPEFNYYTV